MAIITSTIGSNIGGNVQAILSQQSVRTAITYGAWAYALTWQPPPVYVAGIPVSTRQQESYQYRAEATKVAIEDGSPITDHVILEPLVVNIVCEVGNWYPGWAEYSLNLLEKMWKERQQLTLITAHKSIDNMVLVGLRAENEAPHWKRLRFELTFQEIPKIKVETTQYNSGNTTKADQTSGPDVSKSASDATDRGHVQLLRTDSLH
jgi:hypothetical protein